MQPCMYAVCASPRARMRTATAHHTARVIGKRDVRVVRRPAMQMHSTIYDHTPRIPTRRDT